MSGCDLVGACPVTRALSRRGLGGVGEPGPELPGVVRACIGISHKLPRCTPNRLAYVPDPATQVGLGGRVSSAVWARDNNLSQAC